MRHESLNSDFNTLPCVIMKSTTWKNDLKLFINKYYDDIDSVVPLEAEFDVGSFLEEIC